MTAEKAKGLEKWFYITSIATFFGIITVCLVTWGNKTEANSTDIMKLTEKQDKDAAQFEEIRVRLTHIEDAVGAKK